MTKIVKRSELTDEEMAIILSLQGIVNRNHPSLYIDIDNYLSYLTDTPYEYISFQDCLLFYKSYVKGIILFNFSKGDIELNIASSLSGIFDYLIIPTHYQHIKKIFSSLEIIDISNLTGDYIDKQETIFDQYQQYFSKTGLIHQVCTPDNYHLTLRDQGIANRWFCFYTGEDQKAKSFRKKVLQWANPNIAIYGWTTDEISFVDDISKYGDYIIPSDWSCNHSYLDKTNKVVLKQQVAEEIIEDNKHYLTIVVSDGDNAQWLERDFTTNSTFGMRIKSYVSYPISWTIAPSLSVNAPRVIEYIYRLKQNDYFVSGVSGAGYMNPCAFPSNHLPEFCNKTKELMANCDLKVVTLLDNLANRDKILEVINYYSQDDNLIGGIYELDPSKYQGGKGEMFFADNGKPFASVRVSFWSPDGTNESVTGEWIDSIAREINSFPINPTSSLGYTVLNVHPWSTTIDDLNQLISKLSPNIQIIRADSFLKLIKNRVIH